MSSQAIGKASEGAAECLIKWPNDLIVADGKVGGILSECSVVDGAMAVRIGIGVNVNTPPEVLETIERPLWPATSLMASLGREIEKDALLEALTGRFVEHLECFMEGGVGAFLPRLEKISLLARADTFVLQEGEQRHRCRYSGLGQDGALIVTLAESGEEKRFYSAEIVELQPKLTTST